ncbi:hypothetical protein Tco_1356993, partial [Tanacetum coccineum]
LAVFFEGIILAGKTVMVKVEERKKEDGSFGTELQKTAIAKRGLGLLIVYANLTRPTFGMASRIFIIVLVIIDDEINSVYKMF